MDFWLCIDGAKSTAPVGAEAAGRSSSRRLHCAKARSGATLLGRRSGHASFACRSDRSRRISNGLRSPLARHRCRRAQMIDGGNPRLPQRGSARDTAANCHRLQKRPDAERNRERQKNGGIRPHRRIPSSACSLRPRFIRGPDHISIAAPNGPAHAYRCLQVAHAKSSAMRE